MTNVHVIDYFRNKNKAPKKTERERIFSHLKELGEPELTDTRISGWFSSNRQRERKRLSLLPPTPPSDPNETKWVDIHHETRKSWIPPIIPFVFLIRTLTGVTCCSVWPSLTRETLKDLQDLYAELVAENPNANIPYEPWAEILGARPVHVRMWCKAKERQLKYKLRPDAIAMPDAPSQMTEEHPQLPTPGNSTSPEPLIPSTASPDAVKDEPPASPVVDTTQSRPFSEAIKEKTSMGLHDAIENAFPNPLHPSPPTTQPLKLSSAIGPCHQQKPLPRDSCRTLPVLSQPTPPLISATSDVTMSASTSVPLVSTTCLPRFEASQPPPYRETSTPPIPEVPTPGPSKRPGRDLARERIRLVTGVAEKLDELNGVFSSAHGLARFAGSIQNISQRNEQFLKDVSAGRFTHLGLTSSHLPDQQLACPTPQYNPLRVLTERQHGKGEEKERDREVDMDVD